MSGTIAKVVVDLSLDRCFDYTIPDALRGRVCEGCGVIVPFGRRELQGYVVSLSDQSDRSDLKPIIRLVDDTPLVSPDLLKLARWMADYYCAPIETAVRAVLPAAVRRGSARFRARQLVTLAASPAAAEGSSASAARPKEPAKPCGARGPAQSAVLEILRAHGELAMDELLQCPGATRAAVRALERRGLVTLRAETAWRNPLSGRNILPTQPLPLMPEQTAALELIARSIDTLSPPVVLLYGVTGSGKTEVYLQAMAHALAGGKGAIVLVPEIALTPQTIERFVGRFGDRVAVLHSHLSDGERHDEWHRIRDGRAAIVVGARSAVFAPVRNLGLIVVDEEHEPSYKQEESPRYSARDVAVMRGHILRCAVVLGSATPALESWANAGRGKYALARLPVRADDRRMPHMRIVDMRVEAERTGQPGVFSRELIEAIRLRIERAEQTILFLNRRGFATSLVCRKCGHVAVCSNCSVSYTYHRGEERLRCHICGASVPVPAACPACHDPAFKYTGVGTQRVEAIVKRLFPQARVERMDADTTVRKDSYDRVLGDFRAGKISILVGTQMIAKGLHFPNVTLVGVVYADLSLHLPDFRAGERTFQLLAQVAGRAGRGEVPGEVIVQTYTPFHAAVQAARRLDFEAFGDQELEFRKELQYPPWSHLVCIMLRGAVEDQVRSASEALHAALLAAVSPVVTVSDPCPAPLARAKGDYRYQVMLRARSPRAMTAAIRQALSATRMPAGVACVVDVDALSLL